MVFPKNIFKHIFSNKNNNNVQHYDLGKSPLAKPQSWNLSIPKLKEDDDDDDQTATTSSSSVLTPPQKSVKERKKARSFHLPYQHKKFTIHKAKDCQLPIVKVSTSAAKYDVNPASSSAPWIPHSPPAVNEQQIWNLTIPSPAAATSSSSSSSTTTTNPKKRTSPIATKQVKKQKVNHRSRVMSLSDNKSIVIDSYMDQHPVLPTLPVISFDEEFPPTSTLRQLQHPFNINNNTTNNIPAYHHSKNKNQFDAPLSHELIEQNKYDELLQNAIENHASIVITKYLVDMYTRHDSKVLHRLTMKALLENCLHQQEYVSLIQKLFEYYRDKQYNLETEFILFITTMNCTNETQEEIMIEILQIFFNNFPKLFHLQDSQRNNVFHLVFKYQTNYPSTKLIQYLLELNNKKKYSSKTKNLLWAKNDLKQYPLHVSMIKRRSISMQSLQLIIEKSCMNTKNATFLFGKDIHGCTPINYLWMTRVDKDFHLKCYEKTNHTYYKSLYQQSLQQLYHQNTRQVHVLVDLLFGSSYLQIFKWLLSSFDTYLHGIIQLKEIHLEEITLLSLLYPEQLLTKDCTAEGRTPMHYAALKSADIMKILLDGKNSSNNHNIQAAVRIADNTMRLPLHHVIESTSIKRSTTPRCKLELVRKLLQIYPESIEECCYSMQNNINSATTSTTTLIESSSLSSSNKPFYPFMMAAENAKRDDDLDVIYTLLQMSPALVCRS